MGKTNRILCLTGFNIYTNDIFLDKKLLVSDKNQGGADVDAIGSVTPNGAKNARFRCRDAPWRVPTNCLETLPPPWRVPKPWPAQKGYKASPLFMNLMFLPDIQ